MKKIKPFLYLLLVIIVLCGCNSTSKRKKEIERGNTTKEAYLSHNDTINFHVYGIAEKILERHSILRNDSSTMIKELIDTIGSKTHEIYCYFSQNRLISVDNRFYNEKHKPASFMIFDFDENNNCFSVYKKENEKVDSRFYIYYHDSIIVHNTEMSKFLDDTLIKKQIIQEATRVLDSTMKLFPEFKYSFNWK